MTTQAAVSWTVESDSTLTKTTLTYPEQSVSLDKYVKVTFGRRKPVLKSRKRRGASAYLLRVSDDFELSSPVPVQFTNSSGFRFRMYWLFHSGSQFLGLISLACLVVGAVITGYYQVAAIESSTGKLNTGALVWLGLALVGAGTLLAGIRELFTDPID